MIYALAAMNTELAGFCFSICVCVCVCMCICSYMCQIFVLNAHNASSVSSCA